MSQIVKTRNSFAVLELTDDNNGKECLLVGKLRTDIAALKCTLRDQEHIFKEKEDFYRQVVSKEKGRSSKLRRAIRIQKEITMNTDKKMKDMEEEMDNMEENMEERMFKDITSMQKVEIACISTRMEFLKLLTKRVKQFDSGLKVNNFGGFPRRCFQQRSFTLKQHERFMKNFADSDLDLRIFYSRENNSDIRAVLKELYNEYGFLFDITTFREIRSVNSVCMHAKCEFRFRNTIISADIFDRYDINFSSKDYTGNQIEFTDEGITLSKSSNDMWSGVDKNDGLEVLEVILDLQKMETKPLFKVPSSIHRSSLIHMDKMIARQRKMENEGFTLTRKIVSNEEDAEQCPICYESYNETEEHIPPQRYGFAVCGCSFGKEICCGCFRRWGTLCAQCKIPWKFCMTDEPEERNGLQFPETDIILLHGSEFLDAYNGGD